MINYITIGKRVREARLRKKFSQAELAFRVDVTTPYISYIETGCKRMSLETLIKIANVLEVTADVFLTDCLDKNLIASDSEFTEVLKDCSLYERCVIIDTARELKRVMRENSFTKTINKGPYSF